MNPNLLLSVAQALTSMLSSNPNIPKGVMEGATAAPIRVGHQTW